MKADYGVLVRVKMKPPTYENNPDYPPVGYVGVITQSEPNFRRFHFPDYPKCRFSGDLFTTTTHLFDAWFEVCEDQEIPTFPPLENGLEI